jgi:hypothetical protein
MRDPVAKSEAESNILLNNKMEFTINAKELWPTLVLAHDVTLNCDGQC